MEQNYIQHGDDIITITGNTRCTNRDCPGNIENCEYRQQRNDAFVNYTFDGLRWWKENGSLLIVWQSEIAHNYRVFDEEGEENTNDKRINNTEHYDQLW